MEEYHDGTFGDPHPADDDFMDGLKGRIDDLAAIHFASTEEELVAKRDLLEQQRALTPTLTAKFRKRFKHRTV